MEQDKQSLEAFIHGMPKCELHLHLEGTIEPSLVRRLAQRNNLPIPSSLQERSSGYDFHDLTTFLAVYYPNMKVLLTSEEFFDLAWAYLCKCKEEHIIHAECFFDPQAHTSRSVPFSTIIAGYRQAILKAERELGISAALIMCFLRDMDAGFAMATLMEALPYKEWIIGVGLDSDERNNPPSKFASVFERARKEGFLLTMHCDIDQQNSIEHIRQAIEDIKVDRIDHGTNVIEDDRLIELISKKRIGLTCCPVSNSVVMSDFKGREMVTLLRKDVLVTVSSDDPAYFRAYLGENILKLAEGCHLSRRDLIRLQRNAFEVSWISSAKRARFMEELEAYVSEHHV